MLKSLREARNHNKSVEPNGLLSAQHLTRRVCIYLIPIREEYFSLLKRSLEDALAIMFHECHRVVPTIVSSYGPDVMG